jgi:hypothetical protein
MNRWVKILAIAAVLIWNNAVFAEQSSQLRDEKAVTVLKAMSNALAGIERFSVSGKGSVDTRLPAGLIVTNPIEVDMNVQRPGSLHIRRFNGADTQDLYVNKGEMTLFQSGSGFYASTEVPEGIEEAMGFALEELEIEAPLMDLLHHNVFEHLAGSSDPILYLAENSPIDGVDCHHIVIRNAEVDVQLWIENGQEPLPRQLILTAKWEGGSPRFVARMDWNLEPEYTEGTFEFVAPEGVSRIQFIGTPSE